MDDDRDRQRPKQADRRTDTDTQTGRQAGRQTDRQTASQADIDGHPHTHTHTSMYLCMYGWRVCVGRGMQGWLGNCGDFKVEGHRGFGARRADVRRSQGEAAVTRLNLPNA